MVRSFSQLALTCSSPFEFSVRSNDLWKTSVVTMATHDSTAGVDTLF